MCVKHRTSGRNDSTEHTNRNPAEQKRGGGRLRARENKINNRFSGFDWLGFSKGRKQTNKKKRGTSRHNNKKILRKTLFFFRREVLCLCAAGNRGRSRGSSPCRPWCLCCPCGRWKPSTTSSSGRSRTTCRCARPRSTWAAAVGSAAAAAAAAVAAVVAVAVGAAGAAVGAADGAGQPNGRVRCRPDAAAAWLVAAHGSSLRVE